LKDHLISTGNGNGICATLTPPPQHFARNQPQFTLSNDNTAQRQGNLRTPSADKKSTKSEPRQTPTPNSSAQYSPPGYLPPGLKNLMACLAPTAMKNLELGNFSPPNTLPSRLLIKNFNITLILESNILQLRVSNNNNYDHDDGLMKTDDDIDSGKENRLESPSN
jgi:hypothetical protein